MESIINKNNLNQYYGGIATVKWNKPNAFGLYNMIGNVSEWCWDWYDADYDRNKTYNPTGPEKATKSRVCRGYSFDDRDGSLSVAKRYDCSTAGYWLGFRVVCSHY